MVNALSALSESSVTTETMLGTTGDAALSTPYTVTPGVVGQQGHPCEYPMSQALDPEA